MSFYAHIDAPESQNLFRLYKPSKYANYIFAPPLPMRPFPTASKLIGLNMHPIFVVFGWGLDGVRNGRGPIVSRLIWIRPVHDSIDGAPTSNVCMVF